MLKNEKTKKEIPTKRKQILHGRLRRNSRPPKHKLNMGKRHTHSTIINTTNNDISTNLFITWNIYKRRQIKIRKIVARKI